MNTMTTEEMGAHSDKRLDAAGLVHEAGLTAQAVALTMWRHEIVPALGVCRACGRLPSRVLPLFGLRCRIAVEHWERAYATMTRLVQAGQEHTPRSTTTEREPHSALGRAWAYPPPSSDPT